jgi:hypothetical protein
MLRHKRLHRTVMAWFVGLAVLGLCAHGHSQPRLPYPVQVPGPVQAPRSPSQSADPYQALRSSVQVPGCVESRERGKLVLEVDRNLGVWLKKGTKMAFVLNENTEFHRGPKVPRGTEIDAGDHVTVQYRQVNGQLVAEKLFLTTAYGGGCSPTPSGVGARK